MMDADQDVAFSPRIFFLLESSMSLSVGSSASRSSSSFGTESAGARLEHRCISPPFSAHDRGQTTLRRSKSLDVNIGRRPDAAGHPVHNNPSWAGASRRNLLQRIAQLTKDKEALIAQLASVVLPRCQRDASPASKPAIASSEFSEAENFGGADLRRTLARSDDVDNAAQDVTSVLHVT